MTTLTKYKNVFKHSYSEIKVQSNAYLLVLKIKILKCF